MLGFNPRLVAFNVALERLPKDAPPETIVAASKLFHEFLAGNGQDNDTLISSQALPPLPAAPGSIKAKALKAEPAAARTPAVPIDASVKDDFLTCLDCGKSFKTLRRHLMTDHDLTPDAYRKRWHLPESYPMVAPIHGQKRSAMAIAAGFGRKPAALPNAPEALPPTQASLPAAPVAPEPPMPAPVAAAPPAPAPEAAAKAASLVRAATIDSWP